MPESLKVEELYRLQEIALDKIQKVNNPQLAKAKLCGGTAMSRCWLNHRVSYDLDFFLPEGFDAELMAKSLVESGVNYKVQDFVDDSLKANQLHGYILFENKKLKVSFIEDSYFDLFPSVMAKFGSSFVQTEEIHGLYHRKLRTVSGSASDGDEVVGGRQKSRDLFDLYVLAQAHMPIRDFMNSLPYKFPQGAFENGIVSMPWLALNKELKQVVCNPKWEQGRQLDLLQDFLWNQIGALEIPGEAIDDVFSDSEISPKN